MIPHEIDPFARAYFECALWSSTDDAGQPLDKNYNWSYITGTTLLKMVEDCAKFQQENFDHLVDYPLINAGHDFWLTRNHHGAGFWENDFGTKEQCAALTKASHSFGEFHLYVTDSKAISH